MSESLTPDQFRAAQAKAFRSHRRRHTPGQMNSTERKMAEELALEQAAGKILWWAFEPITLKLAHDTRLTVDFAILHADGSLELRDVKGGRGLWEEDAAVKMRVAADRFWMFRFTAWTQAKGGWTVKEFGPKSA